MQEGHVQRAKGQLLQTRMMFVIEWPGLWRHDKQSPLLVCHCSLWLWMISKMILFRFNLTNKQTYHFFPPGQDRVENVRKIIQIVFQ